MGTVVLDAGVIIGFRDVADPHHASAERTIPCCAFTRGHGCSARVSPVRGARRPAYLGEAVLSRWLEMVERVPLAILPIDAEVAIDASRIRAADRSLKLPDALVISTARVHTAAELVTTDRRWPSRKTLKFTGKLTVL